MGIDPSWLIYLHKQDSKHWENWQPTINETNKMRIFAIPKHRARFVDTDNNWLISINDKGEPAADNAHLELWFDDVDERTPHPASSPWGSTYVKFDEQMAEEIIDFLTETVMGDPKDLYIHCTMGQSRSGAVASFARELFELDYDKFKNDNPQIVPNVHVLKTLRSTYQWDK